MRRILDDLGRQSLPPGRSLAIEVLDIDLAGFEQPNVGIPDDLRVVSFPLPHRWAAGNRTFGSEREVRRDGVRTRIARAAAPAPR